MRFLPSLLALAMALLAPVMAMAQPATIRYGDVVTTVQSIGSWNPGTGAFSGVVSWSPAGNLSTGPLTLAMNGSEGTVTDGETSFELAQPYLPTGGNWAYESQEGHLTSNGAQAIAVVPMSPGLVYRTAAGRFYMETPLNIGLVSLDQDGRILPTSVPAILRVKPEHDPFHFAVNSTTFSDEDGWIFDADFEYSHSDEFSEIGEVLPSNDSYLHYASLGINPVTGTPSGASFSIGGNAATYLTGFPSGFAFLDFGFIMGWTDGEISGGIVNTNGSFSIYLHGSCGDEPEPTNLEVYGQTTFAIGTDGALIGSANNGAMPAKTYNFDAFEIGPISANGTLYIPGWKSAHAIENPAGYLLAGRSSEETTQAALHYPGEEEYDDGLGSYAGYTISQGQMAQRPFSIILACANAPFTSLASKVYHRYGGFSGTLDADDASIAALPPLMLYNEYDTVLTRFNYTFLDNKQHQESEIDGFITLPFPSEVALNFEGLELEQCGAPGSAAITQPAVEILSYWAREFGFSELSFRSLSPPEDVACNGITVDRRRLWTLSTNPVPELARPLLLETQFSGDGNILDNVSFSEANTTIQGYPATTRKVYYSRWGGGGGFGDGLTLVVADVTLPFWGATPVVAVWDSGTFPQLFNGDAYAQSPPGDIDPDRNGFPAGINSLAQYMNSTNHRPLVRGAFAKFIPLEYPVRYDPIARRFASHPGEEKERDLVVLNVSSSVRAITPDETDVLFGLSYEGLPNLNLSSLLDDFTDPAIQALLDPLKEGMNTVNSALAGSLSEAVRGPMESLTLPLVTQMVNDIKSLVPPEANGQVPLPPLQGVVGARMGQIEQLLREGLLEGTGPLLTKINDMLTRLENLTNLIENLPVDQVMAVLEALASIANVDSAGLEMVRDDVTAARAYIVNNLIGEKLKPALEQARDMVTEAGELVNLQEIQNLVNGADFAQAVSAVQNDLNAYLQERHGTASKIRNLDPEDVNRRVVEALLNSPLQNKINSVIVKLFEPLKAQAQAIVNGLFDTLNNQLKAYLDEIGGFLDTATQEFNDVVGVKAAEIAGYAVFGQTTMDRLRLDAAFELAAPDDFGFRGALDMERFVNNSTGAVCGTPAGQESIRVKISVFDIPIRVPRGKLTAKEISLLLRLNQLEGQETFYLSDIGGAIDTQGSINFEAAQVLSPFFATGVGLNEVYIAFRGGIVFDDVAMRGGIFLGRTCNAIELLSSIDPEIDGVITQDVVTGIYAFGEAAIPILDYSCMLKIGATAGAGFWLFLEGPSYGGKLTAGVWGKALCLISVRGKLILVGAKDPSGFKFKGTGWLAGGIGWCKPETWFTVDDVWSDKGCWACVLYASVLYHNSWSVDYNAKCKP